MTSVADAPSDSCDEFPAVTLPRPVEVSKTGRNFRRPSSVVSARLHSSRSSHAFFLSDLLSGRLVQHGASDAHGSNLAAEEAFVLRSRDALLTDECEFVLGVTRNAVSLRHDFRCFAHRHIQAGILLLHPRIGGAVAHHHRDRFNAAAEDRVSAFLHDHVRGLHDRLQARVAESVHREAGRGDRQSGAKRRHACDVVPLRAMRLAAAEDHVLDYRRIELRHFAQDIGNAMTGEIIGTGHVERPAVCLRQRRAAAGDHDGFSHG